MCVCRHTHKFICTYILGEDLGRVGDGGVRVMEIQCSCMSVLKTIILLLFLKRENKNKISLHMSVLIHRKLNIMLKTFPRIHKVYVFG